MPLTAEGVVDENGQGITHIDEVEVESGQAADLEVNLEKGNYVLLCNIDLDQMHYQHGMHVSFVVK